MFGFWIFDFGLGRLLWRVCALRAGIELGRYRACWILDSVFNFARERVIQNPESKIQNSSYFAST